MIRSGALCHDCPEGLVAFGNSREQYKMKIDCLHAGNQYHSLGSCNYCAIPESAFEAYVICYNGMQCKQS